MEIQKLEQRYIKKQKLLDKLKELFTAGDFELEVPFSSIVDCLLLNIPGTRCLFHTFHSAKVDQGMLQ